MDLTQYQQQIIDAHQSAGSNATLPIGVCRLNAAAGAVASAVARGQLGLFTQHRLLHDRLGDLLDSAAMLAAEAGLDLSDVAAGSLDDFHGCGVRESERAKLPLFDAGYPQAERLPRRLAVQFQQHLDLRGRPSVTAILGHTEPVVATMTASTVRLEPGQRIGDPLTDNARQLDGYRFHDAIHLGFLAVLNWSPNLRALLRRKRKSDAAVDECEDGARAVFAEEGLAAVLARLAETHNGFRTLDAVDRDAVAVARAATAGLEVQAVPGWLWRRAICQGFRAMHQLITAGGGVIVADLDARALSYQPAATQPRRTDDAR